MRTSIAVARNHAAEVEEEFQRSQAPAECSVLWSHKSTRVIPEPAAVRSKAVRGGGDMRSRTPQLLTMCAAAWLCGLFVLAGMRVQAQSSVAQSAKSSSSELVGQLTWRIRA